MANCGPLITTFSNLDKSKVIETASEAFEISKNRRRHFFVKMGNYVVSEGGNCVICGFALYKAELVIRK